MRDIKGFASDTSGATAVEYALICALISIVVIAAMISLNDPVNGLFGSVVERFNSVETFMN